MSLSTAFPFKTTPPEPCRAAHSATRQRKFPPTALRNTLHPYPHINIQTAKTSHPGSNQHPQPTMPDNTVKKRRLDGAVGRPQIKKRRRQRVYRSDSESDAEPEPAQDFQAVDLDSEDDITNAKVDDGAATDSDVSSAPPSPAHGANSVKLIKRDAEGDDSDDSDADSGDDRKRSKRNDPSAFASSLSKILSTKLSTTKRTDPVLSRSTDAQSAARAAADSVLDVKARRHLKDQKMKALERGRVRDVVAAEEGSGRSVADVMEEERRLRKVAQRGVVKLFNAVRAAQVKAGEAERKGKDERVIGMGKREERVNEMSKKGFLDLIASGGGKKAAQVEEA